MVDHQSFPTVCEHINVCSTKLGLSTVKLENRGMKGAFHHSGVWILTYGKCANDWITEGSPF